MNAEKLDPLRRCPALPGVTGGCDILLPALSALHREPGPNIEHEGSAASSLEAEPRDPPLPADLPPPPTEPVLRTDRVRAGVLPVPPSPGPMARTRTSKLG